MHHTREEVIERTIREFELLDHLVVGLSDEDWKPHRAIASLSHAGRSPWHEKSEI